VASTARRDNPRRKEVGSPWPCGTRRPPAINLAVLSVNIARRPKAEDCLRVTGAGVRPYVAPGASHHRLNDGTTVELRWSAVRGCYGGQGTTLALGCPACSRTVRVLRKPPRGGLGCRHCRPVSFRSHRRSGAQRGHCKPATWRIAQVSAEQNRIAEMLGLQHWPPMRVFWSLSDLRTAARSPDAPRLSAQRRDALERRLNALELVRICAFAPLIWRESKALGGGTAVPAVGERCLAAADRELAATCWAMRRQPRDPRTLRRLVSSQSCDQATG